MHERPDLILKTPPGFHRIAVQGIEVSLYVNGQTVRYGALETVELRVAEGDRVMMVLRPGRRGGIRAELVRSS